jgi:uncharacterized protein
VKKQVKVKPNAKQQLLVTATDGSLTAYLISSPIGGKANLELIQLLAKSFGVPKSRIFIKSGFTSRLKIIEIDDEYLSPEGSSNS